MAVLSALISGSKTRATAVVSLLAVALAACGAATVASARWTDDPEINVITGIYKYTFFRSGIVRADILGYPSFVGAVTGRNQIAVCDMLGGSSIRQIDGNGITTLAGDINITGNLDGQGTAARFNGISSGANDINGLTFVDGTLYLADSRNNAIRAISRTGLVTTPISHTTTVLNQNLNRPVYVASYNDAGTTLFISDQINDRIISIQVNQGGNLLATLLRTGETFGALAYAVSRNTLYYVMVRGADGNRVFGGTVTGPNGRSFTVGDFSTVTYANSLMLSEDESELTFVGTGANGVYGAYSLRVDNVNGIETRAPTLNFAWPIADGNTIWGLLPHSEDSYYVVTQHDVYVISMGPLPDQFSSSSSSSNDESSSSSNDESSSSSSRDESSSSSSGSYDPDDYRRGRHPGTGAFPTNAFPVNDSCLMSQLYYHLRQDAQAAYATDNYYTDFINGTAGVDTNVEPIARKDLTPVAGSVNVSGWCRNITNRDNFDDTISILDLWGPKGIALWRTQDALATSDWPGTRGFLDGLNNDGWGLGPFCFINCSGNCFNMTYNENQCVGYRAEPKCDEICKGAIVSSVVMACAGIVLIVLMAVSPANIFTALIMVPLI